jgi:hypothetical protein
MFSDTVHLSHVNLNPVHPHETGAEPEVARLGRWIRCRRQSPGGLGVRAAPISHRNQGHRDRLIRALDVEQHHLYRTLGRLTERRRTACEGETFLRQLRYVSMKQGDIWYVSFGPDHADNSAAGTARSTRTFKSEVDAKLFAMQILSKGFTVSAGTLNPHQPKQVVGPAQIERWADPGLGG